LTLITSVLWTSLTPETLASLLVIFHLQSTTIFPLEHALSSRITVDKQWQFPWPLVHFMHALLSTKIVFTFFNRSAKHYVSDCITNAAKSFVFCFNDLRMRCTSLLCLDYNCDDEIIRKYTRYVDTQFSRHKSRITRLAVTAVWSLCAAPGFGTSTCWQRPTLMKWLARPDVFFNCSSYVIVHVHQTYILDTNNTQ